MGWILKTANAIRNKKAPKRLIRAETPMSCRVAIVDDKTPEREIERRDGFDGEWRK